MDNEVKETGEKSELMQKPLAEMTRAEKRAYKKELKRRKEEQKSLLQDILETIAYAAVVAVIAIGIKTSEV